MAYSTKQVIVVRKDLNMRKGKIAAQVAHASMSFLLDGIYHHEKGALLERHLTPVQSEWLNGLHFPKIVVWVNSEQELRDLISAGVEAGIDVRQIEDHGHTEFHGVKTLTCAAFGPDTPEKLDPVTGGLPLL